MIRVNKLELLAPAGNLEKLKMAVIYGADAVYLAGKQFGLRAASDNFTLEQMKQGIAFAHERNKKVYITINIIAHNEDLVDLPEYIRSIAALGVDAVIVSDPGVFEMVKKIAPDMEIHISTQANNSNWKTVAFWQKLGAKRVVLARELSLHEIKEIRCNIDDSVELEAFVHGAMCISYSGRCLLSNYMADRDANRGACAHPCRWKYYLMEEKRPGEYMPVYEDARGTYIYNAKDLCMIQHIPALMESGITSFKIEGRVKSAYYVATVVKVYREAIDAYLQNKDAYIFDERLWQELKKVSHREYTTGFYFGKPGGSEQIYHTSSYIREYDIVGVVREYDEKDGWAVIEQRNRFCIGDEIEFLQPDEPYFTQRVKQMQNEEGKPIDSAPHPQMIIKLPVSQPVKPHTIIRKMKEIKQALGER